MDFGQSKRIIEITTGFLILLYFVFTCKECTCHDTSPCTEMETCAKCIQKDPRCAWCSDEIIADKMSRCDFLGNLEEKCSDVISPKNDLKVSLDLALSGKGSSQRSAIQIRPQTIQIELRPNSPSTFSFEFSQGVDYPVDVYYLLDVSQTMKEHRESMKAISQKIANKIAQISSNFTLGVGSFIDKATALNSQRTDKNSIQALLRHTRLNPGRVDFARQASEFSGEIDKIQAFPSLTSPVGTLDAVMQTIVCKEIIGWRPEAKKLLVIATGNDFHYAGDGKLSGIISPNDEQCHVNAAENYTYLDYPSLSQIDRKIRDYNITIIFAGTPDRMDSYSGLSRRLMGSATVNIESPSDILRHISEQYKAMSSSVEMRDTVENSANIKITYNSTCLDGANRKRNICKEVRQEDTITFNVTIELSSCPDNENERNQIIKIFPVGRTSNLEVELKMICDCNCKNSRRNKQDRVCSGRGRYECGICLCDNNTYGKECECDGVENQIGSPDIDCKRGRNGAVCSNRGECKCGKCICGNGENPGEMYTGKFCECSNYNCPRVNDKLCNGHGNCECGRCRCHAGWSGPDCACSNSTEKCIVPSTGVICSGHGKCGCGSCTCDETYYGQFCEDCTSCPGKCEEYGICVECELSDRDKKLPEKECEACREKMINVVLVDKVEVNETIQENACSIEDKEGCRIFFKYEKIDNFTTIIYAERRRECPSPPNVLEIVFGTIGGIIIAGLLLLLMWKLLTDVHDRREFAKFENERKKAQWDLGQNPIFVEPTLTYPNPTFGKDVSNDPTKANNSGEWSGTLLSKR